MIKKLVILTTLGMLMSGCFMAPMALLGPVTSGFTTASIAQSAFTSGANYVIKRSTGKSITQHAFDTVSKELLQQTYFPKKEKVELVSSK